MDWREKVTQEKSLLDVYRKARKIASSKANSWAATLAFLFFIALLLTDWYFGLRILSLQDFYNLALETGEIGFALTTAILGFLIAGFSIFSTITKPEIFAALAKLDHKNSGSSRLQFIFFNFLLVFIHYLAFLAVSIAIKLLLPFSVEVAKFIEAHVETPGISLWWVAGTIVSSILAWLVFLIMLLKSFIWNIYQAVLVVIVTGDLIVQMEKDASQVTTNTKDDGS